MWGKLFSKKFSPHPFQKDFIKKNDNSRAVSLGAYMKMGAMAKAIAPVTVWILCLLFNCARQ
jgi:hypothetical protein